MALREWISVKRMALVIKLCIWFIKLQHKPKSHWINWTIWSSAKKTLSAASPSKKSRISWNSKMKRSSQRPSQKVRRFSITLTKSIVVNLLCDKAITLFWIGLIISIKARPMPSKLNFLRMTIQPTKLSSRHSEATSLLAQKLEPSFSLDQRWDWLDSISKTTPLMQSFLLIKSFWSLSMDQTWSKIDRISSFGVLDSKSNSNLIEPTPTKT